MAGEIFREALSRKKRPFDGMWVEGLKNISKSLSTTQARKDLFVTGVFSGVSGVLGELTNIASQPFYNRFRGTK